MTDSFELRVAMLRAGYTVSKLADKLGTSRQSLYNKMQNKEGCSFRVPEVMEITKLLGLTITEREKIFFNPNKGE